MRSSKRLTIVFTLAVVVASAFGSVAAADAADPTSAGPSYPPGDPHAADDPHSTAPLEYDLAVYTIAKDYGIDLKAADALFKQQRQFNSIGSDLANEYGTDQFDGWITSSTSGQTLHVRTDNAAVSKAFTEKFGSSIDIVAEPARVATLSNDLNSFNDLPNDVDGMYVDPETLGIVVDSHGSDAVATAAAVQSLLDPKKSPGKVAVTTRPDAARNSATVHGGSTLEDYVFNAARTGDDS